MADRELDQRIGLAELRGEMVQMNKCIDDVNRRIDGVDKRIDEVNRRIDDLRTEVRAEIADVRAEIRDLRATLRWVIGIQVTMFIVLAGLILRGIGS